MYTALRDEDGYLIGVRRDSDGACIPRDPANRGWRAFVAWNDAREAPLDLDAAAPPVPTWDDIRLGRDRRLAACDWTQLADVPLSGEARAAWAAYRQALRDIPQAFASPETVAWPVAPGGG